MQINIGVENKVAQLVDLKQYIVCGNSDYIINFLFDDEWNDHVAKTARFEWGSNSVEVPFTGTQCPCPVITNTIAVKIGVFAGDLDATTPAYVMCRKSILCGSGGHDDPSLDVYNQLMGLLEDMQTGGGVNEDEVRRIVEEYMNENPVGTGAAPLFLYSAVRTPGTSDSVVDLLTQETYNSERIREAVATRPVWLITSWDSYGQEWGVFECVPTAFFNDAEQFHGHIWNTDTEEYGHGWIPATATVDENGAVTVEYAELHGYAKSPLHMARFGNLPGNAMKLDYTGAQLNEMAMNREISLTIIMDGDVNGAGFFTAVKPAVENLPNATFFGRYHRDPMGENEWMDAYCTVGEDGIPVVTDIVSPYVRQLAESIDTQVQDALTEAKESGEFKGDPGEPGQPGEPGDDYVLTDADKTEIAEEAAGLIDTALLSIIGEVTE